MYYPETFQVGYEDQVAASLIYQGYVREGLAVTRAIRDRHNGRNRNPYSQLQAGNYYARSLANWGQLLALTGFRYSAVEHTLWLDPKVHQDDLRTFFAAGPAWGTLALKKSGGGYALLIDVARGELPLNEIVLFGKHRQGRGPQRKGGPTSGGPMAATLIYRKEGGRHSGRFAQSPYRQVSPRPA